MLDVDLALLYATETKFINRAVKRNSDRFPAHFCFQLTEIEWESLRFQIGTFEKDYGRRKYLPTVFTEHGDEWELEKTQNSHESKSNKNILPLELFWHRILNFFIKLKLKN